MGLTEVSFFIAAFFAVMGAIGVVASRNPVHSALSLIGTLFSVAVLFLVVQAHFLAAIQVIVYAGAIVILFLFVIMLLGVDQAEDLSVEPLVGQRSLAALTAFAILGLLLAVANSVDGLTGQPSLAGAIDRTDGTGARVPDVEQLAEQIFTRHVFTFEITGLLLTVAVVGAVVMARRITGDLAPLPELDPRLLPAAMSNADIDSEADLDDDATNGSVVEADGASDENSGGGA